MHSAMHSALPPRAQALGNGTTVLVGMPGAFTPTCTDQHLPGFIKQGVRCNVEGYMRAPTPTPALLLPQPQPQP